MLENWILNTEPGNQFISWGHIQGKAGEEFRSVTVDIESMPERTYRIVVMDGVPMTPVEGLVAGAVWKFSDRAGNVCAWVEIAEILGQDPDGTRLFRAKVDVGDVDLNAFVGKERDELPYVLWMEKARSCGVPEDLVDLGFCLMREAVQRGWSAKLQKECGWRDDGEAMIQLALKKPAQARKRWKWLIETEGGRGTRDDATGVWEPFRRDPTRDQ